MSGEGKNCSDPGIQRDVDYRVTVDGPVLIDYDYIFG